MGPQRRQLRGASRPVPGHHRAQRIRQEHAPQGADRDSTAEPGRVEISGRVSSLLELGAGFHSEYSGRENVYLYGTLLGLRRREIDRHYDSIVEFCELADFMETPVKHFSSGMYVRLGFAVAVHLDPEILLIDEVLAVGDAN